MSVLHKMTSRYLYDIQNPTLSNLRVPTSLIENNMTVQCPKSHYGVLGGHISYTYLEKQKTEMKANSKVSVTTFKNAVFSQHDRCLASN
jgi:hypothetical protein